MDTSDITDDILSTLPPNKNFASITLNHSDFGRGYLLGFIPIFRVPETIYTNELEISFLYNRLGVFKINLEDGYSTEGDAYIGLVLSEHEKYRITVTKVRD